jgi:hypothetical protein
MAVVPTQNGADVKALLKTSPDKYISLGNLIDPTKPDNRDLLVETYGDQGITGFLALTGAVRSAGTADEVTYWEEGRLHKTITGVYDASANAVYLDPTNIDNNRATASVRINDVLLAEDGQRLVVTGRTDDTDGATVTERSSLTVINMDDGDGANVGTDGTATGAYVAKTFVVVGNTYAQGTAQPTEFYQTDVTKRVNPYNISKETFRVTGSQATNIGWIDLGGGDYRWYVKGEMDTRKKFMNQREMMMLVGQKGNSDLATGSIAGSEGYFSAIEDRGITTAGAFGSGTGMADVDAIIFELDKQGAGHEYAMYVDTATSLNIDDMLAGGISATATSAGLAGQFGAFNNDRDMAANLGFSSFTRGGYTFHKHSWKLLNDPTLLGAWATKPYKGVLCPMAQVADAKTGKKSPALEMNYKEVPGYSRELNHWVTGGGVLGFNTDTTDEVAFHYRSECNLVTRAANQHVLLK